MDELVRLKNERDEINARIREIESQQEKLKLEELQEEYVNKYFKFYDDIHGTGYIKVKSVNIHHLAEGMRLSFDTVGYMSLEYASVHTAYLTDITKKEYEKATRFCIDLIKKTI